MYQFNIMEYDLVQVWIFCLAYKFYLGEVLLFLYEPIAMNFFQTQMVGHYLFQQKFNLYPYTLLIYEIQVRIRVRTRFRIILMLWLKSKVREGYRLNSFLYFILYLIQRF